MLKQTKEKEKREDKRKKRKSGKTIRNELEIVRDSQS